MNDLLFNNKHVDALSFSFAICYGVLAFVNWTKRMKGARQNMSKNVSVHSTVILLLWENDLPSRQLVPCQPVLQPSLQ